MRKHKKIPVFTHRPHYEKLVKAYLQTASFKALPALKEGSFEAAMVISSLVLGLIPFLSPRSFISKSAKANQLYFVTLYQCFRDCIDYRSNSFVAILFREASFLGNCID